MPFKPKDILKILRELGFIERRQSGSHLILTHPDGRYVVLPMHSQDVKQGLYRGILKQAGLTDAEFRKRFKGK